MICDDKDVLDMQIDLSVDRLINKIVLKLSQLPQQYSIDLMKSKWSKICEYKSFLNYLEAASKQTN